MTQFGYTAMCEQTPARQVGADHQGEFMAWARSELLPALRELG